jgi:hypothetical protein
MEQNVRLEFTYKERNMKKNDSIVKIMTSRQGIILDLGMANSLVRTWHHLINL